MHIYIKENSWIAKWAAYKLKAKNCAIVTGSTIHLHAASKKDFLENKAWLRHEVCHVKQWNKNTYIVFLLHYLWLSILYGYQLNPYEVEAREAEVDEKILGNIIID